MEALDPFLEEKSIWNGSEGVGEESDCNAVEVAASLEDSSTALEVVSDA